MVGLAVPSARPRSALALLVVVVGILVPQTAAAAIPLPEQNGAFATTELQREAQPGQVQQGGQAEALLNEVKNEEAKHGGDAPGEKEETKLVVFEVRDTKAISSEAEDWAHGLQEDLDLLWAAADHGMRDVLCLPAARPHSSKQGTAVAALCSRDAAVLMPRLLEQGDVVFKGLHVRHEPPAYLLEELQGAPKQPSSRARLPDNVSTKANPGVQAPSSSAAFLQDLDKPVQAGGSSLSLLVGSKPSLEAPAAAQPQRKLQADFSSNLLEDVSLLDPEYKSPDQIKADLAALQADDSSSTRVLRAVPNVVSPRELLGSLSPTYPGNYPPTPSPPSPSLPSPPSPSPPSPEPPSPEPPSPPNPSPSPPPPSPSPPATPPPPPPSALQTIASLDWDGSTYSLIGLNNGNLRYSSAEQECRDRDGHLVTVTKDNEQTEAVDVLVSRFFEANPSQTSLQFWTGFKAPGDSVVAVDGSTVEGISFSGEGDCVYYNTQDGGATFSYVRSICSEARPFMCEVSECSECDSCTSQWYNEGFTSGISASNVLTTFAEVCDRLGYSGAACDNTLYLLANSVTDSNNVPLLAKRPGAICRILGDCPDSNTCNIRGYEGDNLEPVAKASNYCTDDGTNDDSFIGNRNFQPAPDSLSDDQCYGDADCGGGKFCSFSGSSGTVTDKCDSSTGLDSTRLLGSCVSLCELPEWVARKERVIELFEGETCSEIGNDGECPGGMVCREASPSCIDPNTVNCTANDDGTVKITSNSCDAQCFEPTKNIISAKFGNSGQFILVSLSTRADPMDVPCDDVFTFGDGDGYDLSSSRCTVVEGNQRVLNISLAGNSRIKSGDTLMLKEDPQALTQYLGGDDSFFQPSSGVQVLTCDNCELPDARITDTTDTAKQSCEGDFDTVTVNGFETVNPSGRPLAVKWSCCDSSASYCTSELQGDLGEATSTDFDTDSPSFDSGSLSVAIQGETILDLFNGGNSSLCVKLEVKNFLDPDNVASSAEHTMTLQGNGASKPVVTPAVPSTYTLPSPEGLRLSGSVSVSSVCEADQQVTFIWRCKGKNGDTGDCGGLLQSNTPEDSILHPVSNADLTSNGIRPGDTLQLELEAILTNSNSGDSYPTVIPDLNVTIVGSPISAAFAKVPQGGVSRDNEDVEVDASASFDPSDPTNRVPMRYSFSCVRADGFSSCFELNDDDSLYSGTQDGPLYTFDANRLVNDLEEGERLFLSVTASKSDGRSSTATSSFVPKSPDAIIPKFVVVRDCEGRCPPTHRSSDPLSLYVTFVDENEEDYSVKWQMNGPPNLVAADVVAGTDNPQADSGTDDVNSFSVTIVPDKLPATGEITITTTVSRGDVDGSASITIQLTGPPVCGRDSCIKLPRDSAQIPSTKFVAQAAGFSSDQRLEYEFGFVNEDDSMQVVQPPSRQPTAPMFASNGAGNYTVYVVAVSEDGSRSKPYNATFTLNEGNTDNIDDEINDKIQDMDFDRLSRTGDNAPVVQGVKELNSYLNAGGGGGSGGSRRALLQTTGQIIDDALRELKDIVNSDDSGVPEALDVLASLSDTFNSEGPTEGQAVTLGQIVRGAMEILDDSERSTINRDSVASGLHSAGLAAETLVGASDAWGTATRLQETIEFAREVIRRGTPAGYRSYANGTEVGVGVSRNTLREMARANIEVDGVPVWNSMPELMRVEMPQDGAADAFKDWCRSNTACDNLNILTLYFTYVRHYEIYKPADVAQTVIDHFDFLDQTDAPTPVSGVLEVQFKDFKSEDAAICDAGLNSGCYLDLHIPVIPEGTEVPSPDGGVMNVPSFDGRRVACVRLRRDTDSEQFRPEVVQDIVSYDGSSGSAECRTPWLGRHMLVAFEAPPEPPSPPMSPPLSPATPSAPPPSVCTSVDARVRTNLGFDLEFDDLDENQFKADLVEDLRNSLPSKFPDSFSFNPEDCPNFITVIQVKPGSVIAELSIDLGANKNAEDAEEFDRNLRNLSPEEVKDLFDNESLRSSVVTGEGGGFVGVDETPNFNDPKADDTGDDADVLGPAIAIPVFFALLVIAAVGYFAYKKNKEGTGLHNQRVGVERNYADTV